MGKLFWQASFVEKGSAISGGISISAARGEKRAGVGLFGLCWAVTQKANMLRKARLGTLWAFQVERFAPYRYAKLQDATFERVSASLRPSARLLRLFSRCGAAEGKRQARQRLVLRWQRHRRGS